MPLPRRKIIIAIIAAAAGIAAVWHWFLALPTVETTHIIHGPAVQAVYASGNVEPTVLMKIGPKITGRLAALLADERDQVKAGQILAQLDDEEMGANVAELKARLELAEREFERARTLLARHTGTVQERDRTESALHAARAAYNAAAKQRSEFSLSAPADGTIIRRDGEVGEIIQINQPVFYMACCAPLRITADVDEEDIPLVKPGQKTLIRADAYPQHRFEGTVDEITPKGDPVARNFRVRVKLPEDTPLMIGMTVEINIITGDKDNAPLLPAAAVANGKVWVVEKGRLKQRTVVTGIMGAAMVEIKSGVDAKDAVATQAETWFRPDRRVRKKETPPALLKNPKSSENVAKPQPAL